ncbi:MAG: hypothetical protein Q8N44_12915 [Rubrivivax sp.]|nr:hypothetical protein [Rubrivivax sp.]
MNKHALSPSDDAPRDDAAPAARGPQALDPALFQHVGGGLPRGGWSADQVDAAELNDIETDLPRGGW